MNSKYLYSVLAFTLAVILVAFFITLIVLLPQLWRTDTYGNLRDHPSTTNVIYDVSAPTGGSILRAHILPTSKKESAQISKQVEQSLEPSP